MKFVQIIDDRCHYQGDEIGAKLTVGVISKISKRSKQVFRSWKGESKTMALATNKLQPQAQPGEQAHLNRQESERILATLIDNLPGMAYRCANDPGWTMTFVSDSCFELTGYHPADLIHNRRAAYGTLIHPDDRLAIWDEVQAALAVRQSFQLTYRLITAEGQEKWVWEHGRGVFSATDVLLALEGFITDITRQVQTHAIAAERSRLARDLHDAVTQTLFSTSIIADVLPRLWERDPVEGRRRLTELRELTRGALAEMRTLLLELRPAALEEAALGDLLRQLADSLIGRARLPIELTVQGEATIPPGIKVAFYRIAQEALNNVAKHAAATFVTVKLVYRARPPASPAGPEPVIELVIRDDGCGFNPQTVRCDHLGLGIMRERAEAVGMMLEIESQSGAGTSVRASWPQKRRTTYEGRTETDSGDDRR